MPDLSLTELAAQTSSWSPNFPVAVTADTVEQYLPVIRLEVAMARAMLRPFGEDRLTCF